MIYVKYLPHGARRQTPNRIIVHAMQEQFTREATLAAAEAIKGKHYANSLDLPAILYADEFLDIIGLSAHALVTPSGDIIRCREDDEGAFHAKGFNTDSLGIEFLVPGHDSYAGFLRTMERPWVADNQLLAGARWIAEWKARWNITQIDGHCDVDPDRKKDPGAGFPWDRLMAAL